MDSYDSSTPAVTYLDTEVLVLGAGPGGYTAAFRAADLGKKVLLVERGPALGGVCLNMGCIPSKALLHAAKVITEAEQMFSHGIRYVKPEINLQELREWKDHGVIGQLTNGLSHMAKQRQITTLSGVGKFVSPHELEVCAQNGDVTMVAFESAIIAAGSQPIRFPGLPDDSRIMDSTGALLLEDIPKRMLVVGGGIIGLELGTVYDAFGSRVSVVELSDGLMQGCDRDLVRPLQKRMEKRFEKIHLDTKVSTIEPRDDGIHVTFEKDNVIDKQLYDKVLIAVGRRPNGKFIGAENAGVFVDERGFIPVDKQLRTNVPHIFAIGDIVGQPMLAHKATHEGKVAAEVIAGKEVEFQASVIPAVAYTDPEVAWVGVTETEARAKGIAIEKATFPWAASGRAISIARTEGLTKLIFDSETDRLIGAGIVGTNAGEILAETALAIEMGADARSLGITIHAHPTLSETVCFAAEIKEETITDLYIRKRP
jgi:dihydrolipoamide dehydrogenase